MKTLIAIIIGTVTLTSCSAPTQKEIEEKKNLCSLDGRGIRYESGPFGGSIWCDYSEQKTSVMDCVNEYTDGLDEKYNNPDTVSNLREDDYSKVVKTCNEIFGEKPQIK